MRSSHLGSCALLAGLLFALPGQTACSDAGTSRPDATPPASPPPEAAVRCAPGRASELIEQGRRTQREKGEGGAGEAIALYRAALEQDPSCTPALWELGWSSQAKGDLDGCVAAWDRLRALAPGYPELDVHYPAAVARRDQAAQLKTLPDPARLPPPEDKPAPGPGLTLAAVGDVNLGTAWPVESPRLPPDGGADLFTEVKPMLKEADITFGNLETVLADSGDSTKCGKRSTRCFAFRVPTSFARMLRDSGFGVMSIANNHTGDFGPAGRQATRVALDAAGILHSGPVGDLASWEVKGRKVALIAFSFGADVYRIQEIDMGRRVVAQLAGATTWSSSPSTPAPRVRAPTMCPKAPSCSSARTAAIRAPSPTPWWTRARTCSWATGRTCCAAWSSTADG